ncbi:MAG TPA: porin, partial [Agitococcus sp.]|nr:porin [Agitococcus sp.]
MDQDTGIAGVDGKVWELNSNSSRIGVKGNEKLTEEFTAVYKAEWEVQGDMAGKMNKAGETVDLGGRERYIGLKHFQWGTVRLGHIDSPFKNAEDDIDVFNDTAHLDMGKFIYGQNRLENSINYVSPKFLDVFGVNLTLQPGEGNAKNPSTGAGINENHIADAISTALSYEDDNLYLSFAMDKEVTNMDAMRFNARYKMGDATVSAMYQMAEPSKQDPNNIDTLDEETAMVLSASYKMDAVTIRGEFLMSTTDMYKPSPTKEKSKDTTLIGVGVDYNFTQATKAFANLAAGNMESTPAGGGKSTDTDTTYIGFGMETRF